MKYFLGIIEHIVCCKIRGMAGKFVDTLAIRKSNALLKRLFE